MSPYWQPSLDQALVDPHAYIRRDANDTSRAAGLRMAPRSGTKRWLVLQAIARSEGGLTDEEIQDRLGMHHNTQTPRRRELVQGGWIEDSGLRRPCHSGDPAVVWVLTADGTQRWAEVTSA